MSSSLRGWPLHAAQLVFLGSFLAACASEPLAESEASAQIAAQEAAPSGGGECGTIRQNAEVKRGKTDIVWVIDTSPSMIDEQQKVKANITNFMSEFEKSNADARAVMVTMPDPAAGTPLASETSRYRFVNASVFSKELYTVALATFGAYQDFLRKDAVTHFVMVTDDEDKIAAESFRTQMEQKLGRKFIQHAIASESVNGAPCRAASCPAGDIGSIVGGIFGGIFGGASGATPGGGGLPAGLPAGLPIPGSCGAAAVGAAYNTLADATKGQKISICSSDWNEVFRRLREAVISSTPLPCDYAIPQTKAGIFDAAQVSASYTSSDGKESKLTRSSKDQCGDKLAWHFDDEDLPARVALCPSTCALAQKGGSIDIKFGCLAL